jgi:hypothetical protein
MVEGSLPFRTGGMPPPGRGIPLSGRDIPPGGRGIPPAGRGIPPAGRGIPPAGRGIPPAGRGIPPAGRGIPPGVQLMIQAGRGIPPAGRGIPPATEEILNDHYNRYLIRNSDVMSTDDANARPRTEEVPTTITNVQETPMRTLNVLRPNESGVSRNVSSRYWRARIMPYSWLDSANRRFLPR